MAKLVVDEALLLELGWQQEGDIWTHPLTPGRFDAMTAIEVTSRAFEGYTGNKAPDWEPAQVDIDWQEAHVSRIDQGGIWHCSEGKFKIYRDHKQAVLLYGNPDEGLIKRIITVFRKMGWDVRIRKGHDDEPLRMGEGDD